MLRIAPLARRTPKAAGAPISPGDGPARSADGDFLGYAMRRFGEPEHVR